MCGGGGPLDFVEDAVSSVGDFVSDTASSVGDFVGGAAESVGDFVGDTVSSAGDVLASIDPGPMLGDAAAAVGDFVGDTAGSVGDFIGDTVGSIGDAIGDVGVFLDDAVNDIIPGGWGTVGTTALAIAAPYALPALSPALAAGLGAATAQGIEGIATGQDWDDALKDMAIAGGTTGLTKGIDFGAADALASGEIAGLTTGAVDDMLSQGLMDASTIANLSDDAIGTMNALNNWTGALTDNIGTAATELASQGVGESELAKYLSSQFGIDAYAAANAAGIASAGGDAASIADVLAADYGAEMAGIAGSSAAGITGAEAMAAAKKAMQVAQVAKQGYGLVNALTGGSGDVRRASPLTRTSSLTDALGGNRATAPTTSGGGALPGSLEETSLAAAPVTQGSNMNLNQLKQLYPQLSTIDPKLLQTLMGRAAATSAMGESGGGGGATGLSMAGQGGTPSAGYPAIAADRRAGATKFAGESPLSGKFSALSAAGLDALGGAQGPYGFKDGGQPHIPQFKTGTTGHYVQGEGDGQSDDIPAMLADGEYVFDADTVAALGNGSNKAGALQLDRMRQEIRKHKRSAHHNKIPPKAKSPLEYMKEGK
jgi:hypothetical protein